MHETCWALSNGLDSLSQPALFLPPPTPVTCLPFSMSVGNHLQKTGRRAAEDAAPPYLTSRLFPQDSWRSSSSPRSCASRSSPQRSPPQQGSILQSERGPESQRRPARSRLQASAPHSAGDIRWICEYIVESPSIHGKRPGGRGGALKWCEQVNRWCFLT